MSTFSAIKVLFYSKLLSGDSTRTGRASLSLGLTTTCYLTSCKFYWQRSWDTS
jgi:hypothetical protein